MNENQRKWRKWISNCEMDIQLTALDEWCDREQREKERRGGREMDRQEKYRKYKKRGRFGEKQEDKIKAVENKRGVFFVDSLISVG